MVPDDRHPAAAGGARDAGVDASRMRRRHDSGTLEAVPASTLMIEVDGFEAVRRARRRNKILDQVSWVASDTLRSTDAVYRYGDSSFCAVLANTPEHEAIGAANRVRANVESMPLLAEAGITVTVGVAAGGDDELAATIARAELAVFAPHESNQVIRAEHDETR